MYSRKNLGWTALTCFAFAQRRRLHGRKPAYFELSSCADTVTLAQMIALGEMTTLYPVSGAFTHYTARFVDPALGFALGWVRLSGFAIASLPPQLLTLLS